MGDYTENIRKSLSSAINKYRAVTANQQYDAKQWSANVQSLLPIVLELQRQAKERVELCRHEEEYNEEKCEEYTEERRRLQDRIFKEKEQMSKLDAERIKIHEEIRLLSQEIGHNRDVIVKLQEQMAQARKDKEHWDTVFWATCWIPLVNIGTGVRKEYEDREYEVKARALGEDSQRAEARINELTNKLREIEEIQRQNNESSGSLANQITAAEGMLAEVRSELDALRQEMALWEVIQKECSLLEEELRQTEGDYKKVAECFAHLMEIEQMLELPSTDRYVQGCTYKGNTLSIGERLNQNEYLLSDNHRFAAIMQSDNNFVVYNSENPLWDTGTYGAQGIGYLELNSEGLLILGGTDRSWNAKRSGAVTLMMQDDGNLVTYDKDRHPLWASDTYIYAKVPGIRFDVH